MLREPYHLERFPEVVDVEPLLLVNRVPPTLGVEVLHDQNLDFVWKNQGHPKFSQK